MCPLKAKLVFFYVYCKVMFLPQVGVIKEGPGVAHGVI